MLCHFKTSWTFFFRTVNLVQNWGFTVISSNLQCFQPSIDSAAWCHTSYFHWGDGVEKHCWIIQEIGILIHKIEWAFYFRPMKCESMPCNGESLKVGCVRQGKSCQDYNPAKFMRKSTKQVFLCTHKQVVSTIYQNNCIPIHQRWHNEHIPSSTLQEGTSDHDLKYLHLSLM